MALVLVLPVIVLVLLQQMHALSPGDPSSAYRM
jgi:hypothetical protein